MRVFYDFEIEDEFKGRKLNPMVNYLLEEIRDFIISRLNVFSETMLIQEEAFNSFVVITITTDNPPNIRYIKYAPSLIKKMMDSFSPGDSTYLSEKLIGVLNAWLN